MEDRLMEAVQVGDIDALYQLIWEGDIGDTLKRIDEEMFADTPLHLAAASGQEMFAKEVLNLMPSFLKKLNKSGLSPMHLALIHGHLGLVSLFLHADSSIVRCKGIGGLTPLHYAAKYGYVNILAYFLVACPESIEDVTFQGKTVFHIAAEIETDTISADVLEILVGWLRRVCHKDAFYWVAELPNLKDEQGKTVLDMINIEHSNIPQIKVLGLLHEINAKSSKRKTVVEVVQRQTKLDRRIVVKMLSKRHRITENSGSNEELIIGLLKSEMRFNERFAVLVRRHKERLSPNAVNALLVVAGLILAAIFPFLYNPPGAFLSVHNNKSADVSLNYNVTVNSTLHVNVTSNPHTNSTGAEGTGVAIIEGTLISITLIIDTFFLTALSIISLLLPEGLFGGILFTALIGFAYFYFACTLVLATNVGDAVAKIIYVLVFWIYGICALILYRIGIRTVTKLEDLKYRLMKNRYSYLASQERSTIAAAPASGGGDEGMEAAAQTTPSASS